MSGHSGVSVLVLASDCNTSNDFITCDCDFNSYLLTLMVACSHTGISEFLLSSTLFSSV